MNNIKRVKITIQGDMWQAFEKDSQKELDELLGKLRGKQLLHHYGNVRTVVENADAE